jgi:hypothetical protein
MALETLTGINEIDGFKIIRVKPDDMSWDDFDKLRDEFPINITEKMNTISFRIQNGPIKEVGVNGCQVLTIIKAAIIIIDELNNKFPCEENEQTLLHLDMAIEFQESRTKNRRLRGVEGISEV